jgi:nucleolar protein 9
MQELRPTFTSLILDPFASHVLRALLIVLCPSLAPPPTQKHSPAARSKKSAAWAARQGQIKPFLSDPDLPQSSGATVTPDGFSRVAVDFVQLVKNASGENEVRALAVDKVASPVLQVRSLRRFCHAIR